ncbi:hypothetical protein [Eubacterium sp.]|uniref:phage distal tail protein n=1 Tax=Eubacterium sp. TaxID=142586 RepID=UPI0026DF7D30|nr:hypothetical protein [Eubacterium sp.]MDO5433320.1 hypothetical protein [Eubacterium sp.]
MKIDKINIRKFKAVQTHTEITPAAVSNESEAVSGSVTPVLFRSAAGMKNIVVGILFRGDDRETVETNISDLTALLMDPHVLTIEDRPFLYHVALTGFDQADLHPAGVFTKVTYNFIGYACGTRKKMDFDQALTAEWKIKGNIPTSAVLTITPTLSIQSATLTGFSEDPITIRNLKKDQAVILDGETGTVTQAGQNKFKDVDLWEFPRLLPGMQKVTCNVESLKIHVEYNPRYL